jgi:hypothetical protein
MDEAQRGVCLPYFRGSSTNANDVRGIGDARYVVLPLALSGDEWIALVGVASGLIGGIGGLVFAYFAQTLAARAGMEQARDRALDALDDDRDRGPGEGVDLAA